MYAFVIKKLVVLLDLLIDLAIKYNPALAGCVALKNCVKLIRLLRKGANIEKQIIKTTVTAVLGVVAFAPGVGPLIVAITYLIEIFF